MKLKIAYQDRKTKKKRTILVDVGSNLTVDLGIAIVPLKELRLWLRKLFEVDLISVEKA